MKPVETLVVLELPSGKYMAVLQPFGVRGIKANSINVFGHLTKEWYETLIPLAEAQKINIKVH